MSKSRNTAQEERVREVQERRRSHAAGKHDPRPRKNRTRADQRVKAIKNSVSEG